MKIWLRKLLLFLKIKVRYDLHRNINDEWTYFTYINDNRNLRTGNIITVTFESEMIQYKVVHRLKLFNIDTPVLLVEQDRTMQEPIENYSIVRRLVNIFRLRKTN